MDFSLVKSENKNYFYKQNKFMKLVLNQHQIAQKITRISHEILEDTYGVSELYIGGIVGNGEIFAQQICEIIQKNSSQKVSYFKIDLDKEKPLEREIKFTIDSESFVGKTIILVDDVINSGKTMQYAVMKVLEKPVHSLKTVALVDRTHRRFPIKCNFVGLTLSTTLGERVDVIPSNNSLEAFLI